MEPFAITPLIMDYCFNSPGFLDIQINGAYGFDFSVYENDDEAYHKGVKMVAERIVETGVTSYVGFVLAFYKRLSQISGLFRLLPTIIVLPSPFFRRFICSSSGVILDTGEIGVSKAIKLSQAFFESQFRDFFGMAC